MKPSQLLQKLRSLSDDRASEDVLCIRWQSLLPQGVFRSIEILREEPLKKQAAIADELMENYVMATQTTNNRSASPNHRHTDTILTNLAQKISFMTQTVGELVTEIRELIRTQNRLCTHSTL